MSAYQTKVLKATAESKTWEVIMEALRADTNDVDTVSAIIAGLAAKGLEIRHTAKAKKDMAGDLAELERHADNARNGYSDEA